MPGTYLRQPTFDSPRPHRPYLPLKGLFWFPMSVHCRKFQQRMEAEGLWSWNIALLVCLVLHLEEPAAEIMANHMGMV